MKRICGKNLCSHRGPPPQKKINIHTKINTKMVILCIVFEQFGTCMELLIVINNNYYQYVLLSNVQFLLANTLDLYHKF